MFRTNRYFFALRYSFLAASQYLETFLMIFRKLDLEDGAISLFEIMLSSS